MPFVTTWWRKTWLLMKSTSPSKLSCCWPSGMFCWTYNFSPFTFLYPFFYPSRSSLVLINILIFSVVIFNTFVCLGYFGPFPYLHDFVHKRLQFPCDVLREIGHFKPTAVFFFQNRFLAASWVLLTTSSFNNSEKNVQN